MLLYQLNQDQKHAFLKLARDVVLADKKLDDRERASVAQLCREMGISTLNMTNTLNMNELTTIFDTRPVRVLAMIELLHLAAADGSTCVAEHEVINGVRKAMGFSLEEHRAFTKVAESYSWLTKEIRTLMGT